VIQNGFFILDRELNRQQFAVFRKQQAPVSAVLPNDQPTSDNVAPPADDEFPATEVTWSEAMDFCEWLESQLPNLPAGGQCRLPTELEWEYTARGPWDEVYPWRGDQFQAWAAKGEQSQPRSVNQANNGDAAWRGVLDMAGNVSEWCLDRYEQDIYRSFETQQPLVYDPLQNLFVERALNKLDSNRARSYRGGSYKDSEPKCQLPLRRSLHQNNKSASIGFRPLIVIPPLQVEKLSNEITQHAQP
jgi:formylglycine-generating enzyme required for sulfatase activity